MDALTITGAFAQIVGLLCDYISVRKNISGDEYNNFISWIEKKHHDQILSLINSNNALSINIKNILNENTESLLQKLNRIDDILAKLSSNIEGLSEIAKTIKPSQMLSDQAISILKQLNESEGSFFLEIQGGGNIFPVGDGKGGFIKYEDIRFIEDDLRTLVEVGLLRLDYNKSGGRLFYITREAVSLLKSIEI